MEAWDDYVRGVLGGAECTARKEGERKRGRMEMS